MTKTIRLPQMIRISEFASLCDVSDKTVRRWIKRDLLKVHRLGRQLRVSEEDAAGFVAARRR